MFELLEQWGVESLIPVFKACGITSLPLLKTLLSQEKEGDLSRLIPDLCLKWKLQKHANCYSKTDPLDQENCSPNIGPSSTFKTLTLDDNNILDLDQIFENSVQDENGTIKEYMIDPVSSSLVEVKEIVHTAKRKKLSRTDDFNVLECLESHPFGIELINFYNRNGYFNSIDVHYLVDIISIGLIKNYGEDLHHRELETVAIKLCNIFKKESVITYYVAPGSKKGSKASGKLVNKYYNNRNYLQGLRKITQLKENIKTDDQENDPAVKNAVERKLWLNVNDSPLVNVIKHWETTYILRDSDKQKEHYLDAEIIINEWPITKKPVIIDLIESDFTKEYSIDTGCLSERWNDTIKLILSSYAALLKKGLNKTDFNLLTAHTTRNISEIFQKYSEYF